MAEVTGFTADRMLAMEDATVIDARLDGYDLILITKDATEINVGDVRGPIGPVGPAMAELSNAGDVSTDPPSDADHLAWDDTQGLWVPDGTAFVLKLSDDENPDLTNRSGVMQVGTDNVANLGIGNARIQTRDGSGGASSLLINAEGGNVRVGPAGVDPNGQLQIPPVASSTLPPLAFANDNDTGLNRPIPGSVGLTANGVQSLSASASAVTVHNDLLVDDKVRIRGVATGSAALTELYWNTSNNLVYRKSSSRRYKTDVEAMQADRVKDILALRPVWFRMDPKTTVDDGRWSYFGFIAEEVAEIDPRLVVWAPKDDCECDLPEDGGNVFDHECELIPEGVQYQMLTAHLTGIVQSQQEQIDDLTSRLEALEAKV